MSKIDLKLLLQRNLIANSNEPTATEPTATTRVAPTPRRVREHVPRAAPPVRMNRALRPRRRS